MAKLANLARMTTATTGTGTITLGSAVSGFKSFAQAGIADGQVVWYAIKDGSNSEVGYGTYTSSGTTLTRTVVSSTNADSAINLSGTSEVFITPSSASLLRIEEPGGRLTLTTATPVLTSTTSAQTTIYYTPYKHRFVPLYDGTSFEMHDFAAELSNATANSSTNKAGPAACTTNSNYDLFVWNDAGTYRLTRGPLWTSDTVRGTGASTTELERVQGILLNKVAITNGPAANRGTYVGTVRTNGLSQVDFIFGAVASNGTAGVLGVWNMYNRVDVMSAVGDSTDSWTYATATVRAANGSNTMRTSYVMGWQEDAVESTYSVIATGAATGNSIIGIGVDVTNALSGSKGYFAINGGTLLQSSFHSDTYLGFHYHQACEVGNTTTTFFGDNGNAALYQNMLKTRLRM